MSSAFEDIKKQTRLALPDDDEYLFRLGVALYGFSSINSFMIEIICHIDKSQNRIALLGQTSGIVLDTFRQTLKNIRKKKLYQSIYEVMQNTAALFEVLNTERADFVHAYPITGSESKQILRRRKDDKHKYFEVTNDFLDDFIRRLHNVSSGLYEIRRVVRPDL